MARKSKKTKNIDGAAAPQQGIPQQEDPAFSQKKGARSIVFNILYYGVLLLLVIAIFLLSNISGGSRVKTYGGFAAFTVLSGSMQSEIPKDSLVITRAVDAGELRIGDDITYIANETTVVTHRIIEITENGNGRGGRAFRTKGVNNPNPDSYQVYEENVIGKVIYHNYYLGRALIFVSKQWPIILFLLAVFAGLGVVLNKILADDNDDSRAGSQQSVQTVQPVQTMQPVQTVQSAQTVQPAQTVQSVQPAQTYIQHPQSERGVPGVIDADPQTVVIKITPQKAGKPDPGKAPIVIHVTSSNERPVVIQGSDGDIISATKN